MFLYIVKVSVPWSKTALVLHSNTSKPESYHEPQTEGQSQIQYQRSYISYIANINIKINYKAL